MIRHLLLLFSMLFLVSCEDTNVLMMTEATTEAVTAVTMTDENVRTLARQAIGELDSRNTVAPDGNPYARRLHTLTAAHAGRDGRSFNFKVYITREVNAFAMADGSVRVFSGLMDLLDDEELLFVIGHEMGHVVQDHSRKKVVLAYATSALRKGLASQDSEVGQIAASVLGSFAEQLTHAQFSQHEERQADAYGAAFLQQQGLELSSAVSALNKLAELARRHTFLSSHPNPEARAKRIEQGKLGEEENHESFVDTLIEKGKWLAATGVRLIRYLLNWLLSLL